MPGIELQSVRADHGSSSSPILQPSLPQVPLLMIENTSSAGSTEVNWLSSQYGTSPSMSYSQSAHNFLAPTIGVVSTAYNDYRGMTVHKQAVAAAAALAVIGIIDTLRKTKPVKRYLGQIETILDKRLNRNYKRSRGYPSKLFS